MDDRKLRRKNRSKVIKTVFETLVILAAVLWVVFSLRSYRLEREVIKVMPAEEVSAMIPGSEITEGIESASQASGTHFIAISYNGLVLKPKEGGKIVNRQAFVEQMQTLKASGYQTISQQDVINAYKNGSYLPEKALLLIFEDGIYETAVLAQPTLETVNYKATMCTYAGNLSDTEGHYITDENAEDLVGTTFWEMGSNGYRVSYINVFDRYENYFGHMSSNVFLDIHNYLRRDYNHYLMDFLRNENRLREESVQDMEKRLTYDYEKMAEIYRLDLGYIPGLYILMHSNTGAYGNDPLVSRKNEELMQKVFNMNFNRQGSCLNMMDATLYDLSRLQSRQYFSTNHLMMRIWDDTGHDVQFRLGDPKVAVDWERICGVAEYTDHNIILTSLPYGTGYIRLNRNLPDDFELNVRLKGNVVGQQSIAMHSDEEGKGGTTVRLHNNVLYVEDSGSPEPIFALDLFEFDGGPFESKAENELAGKKAFCQAIIDHDEDDARVQEAMDELAYLETLKVPTLAEGAEPFIPELDIDEQDDRKLRIQLEGNRISVWLDDQLVADHLKVATGAGSNLVLGSEITRDNERFSQTNLSDDVYDAIFHDLRITNTLGLEVYAFAEPLATVETNVGFLDRVIAIVRRWLD